MVENVGAGNENATLAMNKIFEAPYNSQLHNIENQ